MKNEYLIIYVVGTILIVAAIYGGWYLFIEFMPPIKVIIVEAK